jgi:hypothetical protein
MGLELASERGKSGNACGWKWRGKVVVACRGLAMGFFALLHVRPTRTDQNMYFWVAISFHRLGLRKRLENRGLCDNHACLSSLFFFGPGTVPSDGSWGSAGVR